MMTLSSYWRQRTDPVWPLRMRMHDRLVRSHILMVLSRRPLTILASSYCRQYTPLLFSDLGRREKFQ